MPLNKDLKHLAAHFILKLATAEELRRRRKDKATFLEGILCLCRSFKPQSSRSIDASWFSDRKVFVRYEVDGDFNTKLNNL